MNMCVYQNDIKAVDYTTIKNTLYQFEFKI